MSNPTLSREQIDQIMSESVKIYNMGKDATRFEEATSLQTRATVLALHAIFNELRHGHDQQARLAEAIDELNNTIRAMPAFRADPTDR